jgi:hypothetical protein
VTPCNRSVRKRASRSLPNGSGWNQDLMEVSMKAHLIRIAVIVLAAFGSQPATPAAARPKDPDSFLVTLLRQPDCYFGTDFVDPLDGLCPAGAPELATSQPTSWRSAEALRQMRTAVDAVTSAGYCTLEILMATTNGRTGLWTVESTIVGACVAPDKRRGALSNRVVYSSASSTSRSWNTGCR